MSVKYRIAVIQFPGSNCERETALALKRSGMEPVDVFWSADKESLSAFDGFVLVGGFSYEDRLSAGVIAALSPIMQGIKAEASKGKPVLGICNGAQILVASGIVPGILGGQLGCALHRNKRVEEGVVLRSTYYNDYCVVKPMFTNPAHAFSNCFNETDTIKIPFAHAEGRFVIPQELLDKMIESKVSMFQYQGENPNGSDLSLAAISNKAGNVMAMMPHPERVVAGDKIFESMKAYLDNGVVSNANSCYDFSLEPPSREKYTANEQAFLVKLVIEDNTAKSLELVLKQHDINVTVSRYRYLGLDANRDFAHLKQAASKTTLLYNDAKETVVPSIEHGVATLIIEKDSAQLLRLNKLLVSDEATSSIQINTQGILYGFDGSPADLKRLNDYLEKHHLLYNPFVEDCYDYCK